jgi:hypothetical protein
MQAREPSQKPPATKIQIFLVTPTRELRLDRVLKGLVIPGPYSFKRLTRLKRFKVQSLRVKVGFNNGQAVLSGAEYPVSYKQETYFPVCLSGKCKGLQKSAVYLNAVYTF